MLLSPGFGGNRLYRTMLSFDPPGRPWFGGNVARQRVGPFFQRLRRNTNQPNQTNRVPSSRRRNCMCICFDFPHACTSSDNALAVQKCCAKNTKIIASRIPVAKMTPQLQRPEQNDCHSIATRLPLDCHSIASRLPLLILEKK